MSENKNSYAHIFKKIVDTAEAPPKFRIPLSPSLLASMIVSLNRKQGQQVGVLLASNVLTKIISSPDWWSYMDPLAKHSQEVGEIAVMYG
jgi:hypothetical protein